MQTLKIEMIHDVVCSWCHIGYYNISRALESLSSEVSAEIHYLPFQLNPDMGPWVLISLSIFVNAINGALSR